MWAKTSNLAVFPSCFQVYWLEFPHGLKSDVAGASEHVASLSLATRRRASANGSASNQGEGVISCSFTLGLGGCSSWCLISGVSLARFASRFFTFNVLFMSASGVAESPPPAASLFCTLSRLACKKEQGGFCEGRRVAQSTSGQVSGTCSGSFWHGGRYPFAGCHAIFIPQWWSMFWSCLQVSPPPPAFFFSIHALKSSR